MVVDGSHTPDPQSAASPLVELRDAYLTLMHNCLLGLVYDDPSQLPGEGCGRFDAGTRENGRDWPARAHSMIGHRRMLNLRRLVEHILQHEVPGDFIETGVWRGGACIMMRAILKAYRISDRTIWLADSFEGLPPPDAERYPADADSNLHTYPQLAVSLDEVRGNFARYALLDDQVRFLKGWFRDTLPTAPIETLALMRLDGDMYESTMDGLRNLFPKLAKGGFVIVDDYGTFESCRQAVQDFRGAHHIDDTIYNVDGFGVFWQNLGGNAFDRGLAR